MSSFSMSGFATNISYIFLHSLDHYNSSVSPAEVISIDELLESPMTKMMLSMKIENKQFQLLFYASSIPKRTHLMSNIPGVLLRVQLSSRCTDNKFSHVLPV